MKYSCINGWTKESMLQHVRDNFKGKSMLPNGMNCAYRGVDDKKCAVGLFIPDNLYNVNMENCSYDANKVHVFESVLLYMPLMMIDMVKFQRVHDRCDTLRNDNEVFNDLLNWIELNVA